MGVICKYKDIVRVIEYSEMPESIANLTDENSQLKFADPKYR